MCLDPCIDWLAPSEKSFRIAVDEEEVIHIAEISGVAKLALAK
jgi:hypothetical protein